MFLSICPETRRMTIVHVHIEDDIEQLAVEHRWRPQALDKMSWLIFAEDLFREIFLTRSCSLASSFPNILWHCQRMPRQTNSVSETAATASKDKMG